MRVLCQNLNFSYTHQPLIRNLNCTIASGESVWIKGLSGSGKSSFLRMLADYLTPDSGSIFLGDTAINQLSLDDRQSFRLKHIGYIHQENHLIEHWSVRQNMELVGGQNDSLRNLLLKVNLDPNIENKSIAQLSGGEKQRLSVARLLIQKPTISLLDEPTAHLDDKNTEIVLKLIKSLLPNTTLILVSHDLRMENYFEKPISFSELVQ